MGFLGEGRVEFTPPSDFVEESGGGKGKRGWFKIAGIGCAVLLLLCGIVLALGVVKGISCCGDLKTAGENSIGAALYAREFSQTVQQGEMEQAYKMLSPELQQQLDQQELQAKFSPAASWLSQATVLSDGITGGENMQSMDDVKQLSRWTVRMKYYPAQGSEQLIAVIQVRLAAPAEGETPASYVVGQVDTELREIDFRNEPPARAVLDLHGDLQSGDMAQAFRSMNPASQSGGQAQFKTFIEDQGELFTRSVMEIVEVRYPTSESAVVTATLTTSAGKKALVTYGVSEQMQGMWRIDAITPVIQTDDTAEDSAAPPTDEAPEEAPGEAPAEGEEGAQAPE